MERFKELSALDLYYLLEQLKGLIDSRLDNVYQKENCLFLVLHKQGAGKRILKAMLPHFIYMTEFKEDMPGKPTDFCMALRKYLKGARLVSISQVDFERIINIQFVSRKANYYLMLELISPGNAVLCNGEMKILRPLLPQKWKERNVIAGEYYRHPHKEINVLQCNDALLKEKLANSKSEYLGQFLARELGLGGYYSERVCEMCKLDSKLKPGLVDASAIIKAIGELLSHKDNEINLTLDKLLTDRTIKERSTRGAAEKITKREKAEEIVLSQRRCASVLEGTIEECNLKAEKIYNNYVLVRQILDGIKGLRKSHSWEEIQENLKPHATIKRIDTKKGKITLFLN